MRYLLNIIACGIAFAFAAPDALSASDPIDGTWDLDVAASRFDPGPGRRSDTRTYKVDGDVIRMTSTIVFIDGRTESIQFDAAFDGQDYSPTGNPRVETIAQVRIDAYTSKTTTKRAGVVTATSTRQVSKDGKTLTITSTGTDEKGAAFNNILVFRKQVTSAQARLPATPGKITFLIVFRPGPAWLPGKPVSEQPLKEHGDYILSLYAKGILKFAGPFTDDAGGAAVLEVDSEAQAKEIVANDPAVLTGVFVHELHPWRLVPWEQRLKKKG